MGMKRVWFHLAGLMALPVFAAPYSIMWDTVDAGGGRCTGGVYSLNGTLGQPDASGTCTNGPYAVAGGFWALPIAIQVPGAPTLSISAAGNGQATLSWSASAGGFVLQETLSLTTANWLDCPSGSTNPVTVRASSPVKYYRLHKQP